MSLVVDVEEDPDTGEVPCAVTEARHLFTVYRGTRKVFGLRLPKKPCSRAATVRFLITCQAHGSMKIGVCDKHFATLGRSDGHGRCALCGEPLT